VLLADQQTGITQAAGYVVAAAVIDLNEVMLMLTVLPIPTLVAPPEQLGQYLACYTLACGSGHVIAPTMASFLIDPLLPSLFAGGAVVSGVVVVRRARQLLDDLQRN